MKHTLIIAARNFVRLMPITAIAYVFALIATKSAIWALGVTAFFALFWWLSTVADIRYRKAIKKFMEEDHGQD